MRIEIYDENKIEEKTFRLKLFLLGDRIVVALADKEGNKIDNSGLVTFRPDMTLVRCCNIGEFHGLPLNDISQLRLTGEDD